MSKTVKIKTEPLTIKYSAARDQIFVGRFVKKGDIATKFKTGGITIKFEIHKVFYSLEQAENYLGEIQ